MSQFRLIAVLHLPPLPGAANYNGASVMEISRNAVQDTHILQAAGFSHVMIQDASDIPQPVTVGSPTVAALSVIGSAVRASTHMKLGVIAGHNDGASSVAIAHAIAADFVRVKLLTGASVGPAGFMEGCCLQVAQMKRLLHSSVEVWADAHEATSSKLVGDVCAAAQQLVKFGSADKVIVTRDSGVHDALDDVANVKRAIGDNVDVLIGGRVGRHTLVDVMGHSDGAILGSVLKSNTGGGDRVDPAAAEDLGAQYRAYISQEPPA